MKSESSPSSEDPVNSEHFEKFQQRQRQQQQQQPRQKVRQPTAGSNVLRNHHHEPSAQDRQPVAGSTEKKDRHPDNLERHSGMAGKISYHQSRPPAEPPAQRCFNGCDIAAHPGNMRCKECRCIFCENCRDRNGPNLCKQCAEVARERSASDAQRDAKRRRREMAKAVPCPHCDQKTNYYDVACKVCNRRAHSGCGKDGTCFPCLQKKNAALGPERRLRCDACKLHLTEGQTATCKGKCRKKFHKGCLREEDGICKHCHTVDAMAKAAVDQAEAIHAVEHAEEAQPAANAQPEQLTALDIGWLQYKPDTKLMPLALVQGCISHISDGFDWPYDWDFVQHHSLKNVVAAAAVSQLNRTSPKYGILHAAGGPGVDDHFASLYIMPKHYAVSDPLRPNRHPGLDAALQEAGIDKVEWVEGRAMDDGIPCWRACLEDYISCRLFNEPSPGRTLFPDDAFDSADGFRATVKKLNESAEPPAVSVATPPVRNDTAIDVAMPVDDEAPPKEHGRQKRTRDVDTDGGSEKKPPPPPPPPLRPRHTATVVGDAMPKPVDGGGKEKPTPPPPPPPPPRRSSTTAMGDAVPNPATAAPAPATESPKAATTSTPKSGPTTPSSRFHRAKGTGIKPLTPAVPVEPGFVKGSHYLRRAPTKKEVVEKITDDPKLRDLLTLPMMVLPDQPSLKGGIEDETRRRHLYAWKDMCDEIEKLGQRQETLELAVINAIDSIAKNRKWAPTSKSTQAAATYGMLLRLDQYSNLGYTIELEGEGSMWKDASKKWLKEVCGHSPRLGEVTAEGMMEILKPGRTSLGVAVLLILCWSSTGRPFNWLYVQKEDLIIGDLDKSDDPGHNLMITWRDHKTVAKRGAFTVPSWLPKEWGTKVKRWLEDVKGDWIFPKAMWDDLKNGARAALKEASAAHGKGAQWDLKALRRGSLSTMARNGVPLATLRLFSGHKSDAMLLRYLGYGVHAAEQAMRGAAAARLLHK